MKMLKSKDSKVINLRYFWFYLPSIDIDASQHTRYWISKFALERIPLPPIEIQDEIVKILDTFSSLEKLILDETDARKKQYSYYVKSLINNSKIGEKYKLEDLCEYRKDRVSNNKTEYPYIGVEDLLQDKAGIVEDPQMKTPKSSHVFREDDILIGNIRPYLKKIWFAEFSGLTNGDVLVIKIKDNCKELLRSDFLFHILSSDDFFEYNVQNSKGAKMPRGDKKAVMEFVFHLPSIEEQARISNGLSLYHNFINDSSSGLPAEINARRKQVAFYRQKLLTINWPGARFDALVERALHNAVLHQLIVKRKAFGLFFFSQFFRSNVK
jgi:type I restriction enzyme S subunit